MSVQFDIEMKQVARRLVSAALQEDLHEIGDLTSQALIERHATGSVDIVARESGVLAGMPIAPLVFERGSAKVTIDSRIADGTRLSPGDVVATVSGPVRALLSGERTVLNFLTHLSGVATRTRKFVDAVAGTQATILDTRKTLPGWRNLQKYAVLCGGGANHRMGLFDAVLIKDNHLAAWRAARPHATIADAVRHARNVSPEATFVEVEVDTLEQLADALQAPPDIVLLDNMDCDQMRRAVTMRNDAAPDVLLEASGGITLATAAEIAATGVDRISVGGLTHSAPALDLAFDWSAG
ncbi:Nicotinate-nucleotide pyrophosphorylase [carboxylating] [Maioricimonas rarisocia]|uniref:Probable nicotinate-nucleotide pyrophosphorylase [carboxylating] n=1 Tax=Maioricimonas rarisocia TaxID=2528026 RepID=A0A517Z0A3_9PLAN|nr:carboxylating nicotinate-nucleotide diphosphorylase [Maioricimonas rarisocia]QDU35917.1 Nicotinate-nucleotide pyrophosphorylase [carboxylating] [Maioricimonas rarisocia]